MNVQFFKHSYKPDYESRMNAQSPDIVAIHITCKKFAFGVVLTRFASFENCEWSYWHLLTVKLGQMDYKWRFMKGGSK